MMRLVMLSVLQSGLSVGGITVLHELLHDRSLTPAEIVGAFGVAFVTAGGLKHEFALEDLGPLKEQPLLILIQERLRDDDLIEQVPCIVVGQGTYAFPVVCIPRVIEF